MSAIHAGQTELLAKPLFSELIMVIQVHSKPGRWQPSIIVLFLWAIFVSSALAHPESHSQSCHYHLDLDEQHCSADKVIEPKVEAADAAAGDTAASDTGADSAIVQNFQQLEAQASLIASIQGSLSRLGYRPGPATGDLTSATRTAIKRFQKDNFLPQSGQPSLSLLQIIEDEMQSRFGGGN